MVNIKARISRQQLLFEKLHAAIMKERQALMAGDEGRLPLLDAKKRRIMKAVDDQPLGDIREGKQDAESRHMLVLLEEKVRSVMKEAIENQRLLREQLDKMTQELRSMKKGGKVRSAYGKSRPSSSMFIDDKK